MITPDVSRWADWTDGLNMLRRDGGHVSSEETSGFINSLTEIGLKIKLLGACATLRYASIFARPWPRLTSHDWRPTATDNSNTTRLEAATPIPAHRTASREELNNVHRPSVLACRTSWGCQRLEWPS
jgi:hypothetical protein